VVDFEPEPGETAAGEDEVDAAAFSDLVGAGVLSDFEAETLSDLEPAPPPESALESLLESPFSPFDSDFDGALESLR